METPLSATPVQPVVQPSVQPGHEGHGDGCAQCLADRKLAACREDYARLHHGLMMGERVADDAQSQRLLEACRRLAAVVVTEWSFSESRPVLPSDEVVESRIRELLEPMLIGIPTKDGGSR